MTRLIDMNADLGESAERWDTGEDEALLAVVSSANVSTGAYAGDDDLILATCAAAVRLGVRIGAQVGYPDREGFGRRPMEFEPGDLTDEVRNQIRHLAGLAGQVGADIAYVKPHGALYHRIITDPVQAQAVRAAAGNVPLMGMAGTLPAGRPPEIAEGFADRGYAGPTALLPRGEPGALITDPAAAGAQ
ncbi:MAG TPA: LamB/YcsF family protein, partial [Aeromicrobium sp.]|nr:LamB/YcsF family protein [Aeromicrobium sp.]